VYICRALRSAGVMSAAGRKDVRRGSYSVGLIGGLGTAQSAFRQHQQVPSSSSLTAVNPRRSYRAKTPWRSYRSTAGRPCVAKLEVITARPLLWPPSFELAILIHPQQREYKPRSVPDKEPGPGHLTGPLTTSATRVTTKHRSNFSRGGSVVSLHTLLNRRPLSRPVRQRLRYHRVRYQLPHRPRQNSLQDPGGVSRRCPHPP
jgi:hypothetical protein